MPRFRIDGDPISIAYGYEHSLDLANIYLSVFDKRLRYDSTASEDVNSVAEQVGNGEGSYFNLRTGSCGSGIQVDHVTMAVYLKRFGVSQGQIDELPLQIPKPSWSARGTPRVSICALCRKPGDKKCASCHSILYCSDTCQRVDWRVHQVFCALHPFPAKQPEKNQSVQGILLPEKNREPLVVDVPLKSCSDVDCSIYYVPELSEFLGELKPEAVRSDDYSSRRSSTHPTHAIHLFQESCLREEIDQNACIAHIFANEFPSNMWRGNIVALKSVDGWNHPEYVDLDMTDTPDVIEFFRIYGLFVIKAAPKSFGHDFAHRLVLSNE